MGLPHLGTLNFCPGRFISQNDTHTPVLTCPSIVLEWELSLAGAQAPTVCSSTYCVFCFAESWELCSKQDEMPIRRLTEKHLLGGPTEGPRPCVTSLLLVALSEESRDWGLTASLGLERSGVGILSPVCTYRVHRELLSEALLVTWTL